ncbi:lipoyl(octanoyl) transferase LipB [Nesterenkonia sp. MY13]|uniref:Octanoyltransferase n=1 Tax=Nesterenkonia sedimenti TaxID=1463632 RepID=A0A7X8YCM2_9MICC|nr:lipoyl(octanoyl) transferase LipB [Nesterenkonia sedimenti]NLS08724.1 lipoyl(octanoyl) transferase LipB [Nesterenkonia sedimenti]
MVLHTRYLGFDPDLVDYTEAWDLQRHLHQQIVEGTAESTLLLLEHTDVYTAGKRTEEQDLPQDGTPVVNVDRGGKITWHGRGQLVGYPLLHLRDRSLVKDYVCALESAIIKVLAEDFGIHGQRVDGRSGVWLLEAGRADRKIAAIGIRVHHSVTMHGFALNCSNDLSPFGSIIPCGISDADTTSISAELGRTVTPEELAPRLDEELQAVLPRYIQSTVSPQMKEAV